MGELDGFTYVFEPGSSARTLLLLHGTGADERDLLGLGRFLDPDANLLSPRGRVTENGMPRFFRRFAEGVLDIDDLKLRTRELGAFVAGAAGEHGLDVSDIAAVGFSNGANIASSLLLQDVGSPRRAVLLRPMFTYEPDEPVDLAGTRVFIGSGRTDPIVDPQDPERLAALLRSYGADVTLEWSHAGHGLTQQEAAAAREWLAAS